jgi:hypothetical protein
MIKITQTEYKHLKHTEQKFKEALQIFNKSYIMLHLSGENTKGKVADMIDEFLEANKEKEIEIELEL